MYCDPICFADMNGEVFAAYVNTHIGEGSDLPRLGLHGLARWARLGLLEPPYQRRHLERAIELLLLERAVKLDAEGAARQEAHP